MKTIFLLIAISNYRGIQVIEIFDNIDKCLEKSKEEISKPWNVIDPGFYNPRIITNLSFCVPGNILQSTNTTAK